jgi:hypothetical protein
VTRFILPQAMRIFAQESLASGPCTDPRAAEQTLDLAGTHPEKTSPAFLTAMVGVLIRAGGVGLAARVVRRWVVEVLVKEARGDHPVWGALVSFLRPEGDPGNPLCAKNGGRATGGEVTQLQHAIVGVLLGLDPPPLELVEGGVLGTLHGMQLYQQGLDDIMTPSPAGGVAPSYVDTLRACPLLDAPPGQRLGVLTALVTAQRQLRGYSAAVVERLQGGGGGGGSGIDPLVANLLSTRELRWPALYALRWVRRLGGLTAVTALVQAAWLRGDGDAVQWLRPLLNAEYLEKHGHQSFALLDPFGWLVGKEGYSAACEALRHLFATARTDSLERCLRQGQPRVAKAVLAGAIFSQVGRMRVVMVEVMMMTRMTMLLMMMVMLKIILNTPTPNFGTTRLSLPHE